LEINKILEEIELLVKESRDFMEEDSPNSEGAVEMANYVIHLLKIFRQAEHHEKV
jgi:hypothetical protein